MRQCYRDVLLFEHPYLLMPKDIGAFCCLKTPNLFTCQGYRSVLLFEHFLRHFLEKIDQICEIANPQLIGTIPVV